MTTPHARHTLAALALAVVLFCTALAVTRALSVTGGAW